MQEGNCDYVNCPYIREISASKDEELRQVESGSEERLNEIRRLRSVIRGLEEEHRVLEERLIYAGMSTVVPNPGITLSETALKS